jgi:hypothetical protein
MDEIRIGSWLELQDRLFADSWDDVLGLHRSGFAFRGRWNADDDLGTSLIRLGGDSATLEGHLLRAFRKYAAHGAVPVDSLWNWLALGRHHGLPRAHEQAPPRLRECLEEEGADVCTTESAGSQAASASSVSSVTTSCSSSRPPSTSGSSINTLCSR